MFDGTPNEISKLVEPGRVHSRVYTDNDIFDLERERILGRAWMFAGHTSQIPNPGDYVTSDIGRQPIIFIRHKDGKPQVLLNRCAHRGPKVCNEPCGNAKALTCLYHGWTCDTDGSLIDVSMAEGSAPHFDNKEFGLAKAPRMGEYRGFIFVSLAEKGGSFEEFLGPMKANIDDLVDRAPDEMNSSNIRLLNVPHSGSSFIQTDDLECFRLTQEELRSKQSDWVDLSRGMGVEEHDPHFNALGQSAVHEMAVRSQYQAWLHYMCEAA